MFPTISPPNNDYSHFVADQLLTATALNDLFEYLDEQERLTRANLIGVGIVCGLEARLDTSGTAGIIFSKGCGITSKGYLVSYDDVVDKKQPDTKRKFTYYKKYDPFKKEDKQFELLDSGDNFDTDNYYTELFTDAAVNPPATIELFELLTATEDGATPIDTGFLTNPEKIVMVLVELKKVFNKNCDPESCDDKGESIEVDFRFLLLKKTDADKLIAEIEKGRHVTGKMPEYGTIRRFDVPATNLTATANVFQAYLAIFQEVVGGKNFILRVQQLLGSTYNSIKPFVKDIASNDPFADLEKDFDFLLKGAITDDQLVGIQYYYDFFSDLLQAHNELGKVWSRITGMCCPPNDIFPRHLFLGKIMSTKETDKSKYRTHFIPSPAIAFQSDLVDELRFLFRKMLVMLKKFDRSAVQKTLKKTDGKSGLDKFVRVTPSKLGDVPFSAKAIPFYYDIKQGSGELYQFWNYEKSKRDTADQNLSYHAIEYNKNDAYVNTPLRYDLEPYNFLRIEGHVGKSYKTGLKMITQIKNGNRLPFDVIALSTDLKSIFKLFTALQSLDKGEMTDAFAEIQKHGCCFSDIFLMFDDVFTRILCCLFDQSRNFMDQPTKDTGLVNLAGGAKLSSKSKLAKKIATDYKVTENTIGHSYYSMLAADTINNQFLSEVVFKVATEKADPTAAMVVMPYKIDRMAEVIPDHITELDVKEFEIRYNDLMETSAQMKNLFAAEKVASKLTDANRELIQSRLNFSCLRCLFAELVMLMREFLMRLLRLMIRQKLGFYATINPGIQHKAGVTMGGTFILVYHESTDLREDKENLKKMALSFNSKPADNNILGKASFTSQPLLSSFLVEEELKFLVAMLNDDSKEDAELEKILDGLDQGIVIADFYLPYLCCSDCPPMQFVVQDVVEPEPENKAPIVDAGDPQAITLPADSVTLTGKASDPDGTINSYSWIRLSGPNQPTLVNADKETATANGLIAGVYVFELTVTDDKNAMARDTVTVTVNPAAPPPPSPNQPPVANIKDITPVTLPQNAITLDGSLSSDPEGDALIFEWTTTNRPAGSAVPVIAAPNASTSPVSGLVAGSYVFNLKVTDTKGATGNASISVIVNPAVVINKVCGPLSGISQAFDGFLVDTRPGFNVFRDSTTVMEVRRVFERIKAENILNQSAEKQLGFFRGPLLDQRTTTQLLQEWLADTNKIIVTNVDLRLPALTFYRILVQLGMFIACIKKEDYDKGDIPLQDVFNDIGKHIKRWVTMQQGGQFSHFDVVKFIQVDMTAEDARINTNGEAGIKQKYQQILKAITNLIP
jgi:hypothetical protein